MFKPPFPVRFLHIQLLALLLALGDHVQWFATLFLNFFADVASFGPPFLGMFSNWFWKTILMVTATWLPFCTWTWIWGESDSRFSSVSTSAQLFHHQVNPGQDCMRFIFYRCTPSLRGGGFGAAAPLDISYQGFRLRLSPCNSKYYPRKTPEQSEVILVIILDIYK